MSLAYKTCPECGYPAALNAVKCYRCKRRFQHPIITRKRRQWQVWGWGWLLLEYGLIVVLVLSFIFIDKWWP